MTNYRVRVYCAKCRNELTATEREVDSSVKPTRTLSVTVHPGHDCADHERLCLVCGHEMFGKDTSRRHLCAVVGCPCPVIK